MARGWWSGLGGIALGALLLGCLLGGAGWQLGLLELAPWQGIVARGAQSLQDWGEGILKYRELAQRERQLREENARLRLERDYWKGQEAQVLRLRSLLKLKTELPGQPKICARVIARDPQRWYGRLSLDRGYLDGVRPEMVAVGPEGLVGLVREVGARASKVELLWGGDLQVPVKILPSQACGVLYVERRRQGLIKYISYEIPVEAGELVVTSGLGNIYPAGLSVGRVEGSRAGQDSMSQEVTVNLSSQFTTLQELLLLPKGPATADPALFKEAIERAEEASKRAKALWPKKAAGESQPKAAPLKAKPAPKAAPAPATPPPKAPALPEAASPKVESAPPAPAPSPTSSPALELPSLEEKAPEVTESEPSSPALELERKEEGEEATDSPAAGWWSVEPAPPSLEESAPLPESVELLPLEEESPAAPSPEAEGAKKEEWPLEVEGGW